MNGVYNYPRVAGEWETIAVVSRGSSLARFGDGEAKLACGYGYSREPGSTKLAGELREVMTTPHAKCLVGIPTMDPRGPKFANWTRHANRFMGLVNPAIAYYSAFVTRPDSAPWIDDDAYGIAVQGLWKGKNTVVVCERDGSMIDAVRRASPDAVHIECPHERAYAEIDRLEHDVLATGADVAILSAGPTATCLANRLARAGMQAVDLGSMGRFLCRVLDRC